MRRGSSDILLIKRLLHDARPFWPNLALIFF
jgi:hypothetical protein